MVVAVLVAEAGAVAVRRAATPQLYAFDKATGKQVGAVAVPSVNSAVPMTFLHEGRQYIVFATGVGDKIGLIALALPKKPIDNSKH